MVFCVGMQQSEDVLKVEHLIKRYGTTLAINDISFSIPRGQFFGFLGPNGAGKSSTISCITGTARITEGSIAVDGLDVVNEYKEARKKIGISPQEFNVNIFEKTEDIIDYMAGYYGLRKKQRTERVSHLLDRFELTEHREKAFRELSGGLKRRVILARALVHDPELLILDEPTAGVDVEQRHALWKYFRELNETGKTIILTSHYLEEVELLCDRVVIINKGKIASDRLRAEFEKDNKTLEERYLEITKGETY